MDKIRRNFWNPRTGCALAIIVSLAIWGLGAAVAALAIYAIFGA